MNCWIRQAAFIAGVVMQSAFRMMIARRSTSGMVVSKMVAIYSSMAASCNRMTGVRGFDPFWGEDGTGDCRRGLFMGLKVGLTPGAPPWGRAAPRLHARRPARGQGHPRPVERKSVV